MSHHVRLPTYHRESHLESLLCFYGVGGVTWYDEALT